MSPVRSTFTNHQVQVVEVLPDKGIALCTHVQTGHSLQIGLVPVRVRPPRVGDHWLVDQTYGTWTFAALVSEVPLVPTVTGARSAADPVTLSLLSALVALGLVQDGTV